MSPTAKKLVVIGGVAGGTSAASRARRIDQDLEIVLFEKDDVVSYGACDEPYYIAGEVPSWENLLVRAPEQFETRQNIRIRLRHEVTRIDTLQKTVSVTNLETGQSILEPWDRLIIATGAHPRPLEIGGADLPGVFQMKFLSQARRMKEYIDANKPKKGVIIGAGFVGLEMAEALVANGIEVTICHRSEKPGGATEPAIAHRILKTLSDHGVTYLPRCTPETILAGENGRVSSVRTSSGEIKADLVLGAIGVDPAVKLAKDAGIRLGPTGAIATDEHQQTSVNGVYAAGDCCEVIHRISGCPIYTPLGDIANKQGWCAGENAAGGEATFKGSLGSMHFRCFDLEVGMTGLSAAQASGLFEVHTRTIEHPSRAHAQPKRVNITVTFGVDKATGRLIGAQIAGTEGAAQRINTLAVAIHNSMTISQINELDFAYAPPFSPVIDPILMAARVTYKDLFQKS